MKKIMVSGIQPTNNLTLGNYLGAIKNFVNLQNEFEMYIFIADLHALSSSNVNNIYQNSLQIVKTYLACGIDPNKTVIFRQSDLHEHAELFNVLLNHTTIGELSRMTQFKDKSANCKKANGTEFIPTSLLTYPVLMAADILLHNADVVIVGQDQKQHLELTRNIAERLNNKYQQNIFKIPEPYINKTAAKILDLQNPAKKMSKTSSTYKGVVFLNEPINDIRKKISTALTDNFNHVKFDEQNQPGISNLISIYVNMTNKTINEVEKEFSNIPNYGVFKNAIADVVCNEIDTIQNKIAKITDDEVISILQRGLNKVADKAKNKLQRIYQIMEINNG